MKVTPVKKSFNRHKVGDVFELPDSSAKKLIRIGLLRAADAPAPVATVSAPAPVIVPEPPAPEPVVEDEEKAAPVYQTRSMAAELPVSSVPAKRPYVRRNQSKD